MRRSTDVSSQVYHDLELSLTNNTVEEKHKKEDATHDDSDESSSSNETEDEEGFLATEDLDAQISATLHAIRTKDPRVYDKNITFVELPEDETLEAGKAIKEKPVFLKDYHREKLLRGDVGASDDEDDDEPQTYAQEQDALKKSIMSEINATKDEVASDDSDDDEFVKRKESVKAGANGVHPSRAAGLKLSELDVAAANRNPETFLSNFMASRAWIPEEGGRWTAFDSDEGEDDGQADEWEQAYNLRFEDPTKSNEVLKSYSRDFAAARSVRREEKTGRKRQRELEKEKKEDGKRGKREEKARLRRLKLDETEAKLRKIKQAAGAAGKHLSEEEWMKFLDDAWEDDKWEQEMQKRFGDDYYAVREDAAQSDDEEKEHFGDKKNKKQPKKPQWDEDIDIKDLVPDFEDDEARVPVELSGDENEADENEGDEGDEDDEDASRPSKKRKTTEHKRARLETQKAARQERTKLEALVDSKLELTNHHLLNKAGSSSSGFRYRETSPQSFGMTARDILLAPSDKDLNEFAGLKKLASFRDLEKKRKDRKRLGKKARLREWRRGVFGREFEREGPTFGFERLVDGDAEGGAGTAAAAAR